MFERLFVYTDIVAYALMLSITLTKVGKLYNSIMNVYPHAMLDATKVYIFYNKVGE